MTRTGPKLQVETLIEFRISKYDEYRACSFILFLIIFMCSKEIHQGRERCVKNSLYSNDTLRSLKFQSVQGT